MRALVSSALKADNLQDLVTNGSIAGAGSGHKSATEPIPPQEPNIPAMAYRIEESWPLGREPAWRRSRARVASCVGTAVAGLAAGGGKLRGVEWTA